MHHMWSSSESASAGEHAAPGFSGVPLDKAACIEPTRLRHFLRLSRAAVDDKLAVSLNSIDSAAACDSVFADRVVPLWQQRDRILEYCSQFAFKSDSPNISDSAATIPAQPNAYFSNPRPHEASHWSELRNDPYALLKAPLSPSLGNTANLVNMWVATEKLVEAIVRLESARVLAEKCYYLDWLARFNAVSSLK